MGYGASTGGRHYAFADLRVLMAKATPARSGDELAGVSATSEQERVAAQRALAEVPLARFLEEPLLAPEHDFVSRLIFESHDSSAFAPIRSFAVGEFRDWLLSERATPEALSGLAPGLFPEMAAAVSKLMRAQDLVLAASKVRVVTAFRNTLGLAGRLSTRIQPNHPTDDIRGILAAVIDGLLLGGGDAVIGVNPVAEDVHTVGQILRVLDEFRAHYEIPTQTCVLSHVTTQMAALAQGAPVDLVFQSIGGTEGTNRSFGVDSLALLGDACEAARGLGRGTRGDHVMYFETGQGSALSAGAHHGIDQQTLEARAYAVARRYRPLLVNTVVGFIGPEYLANGKQITRAGLEDHFCGKLLGLPMGCDVCFTNHADADFDDLDTLLLLLAQAGCNYIMGVPGGDDTMLSYQTTSYHDARVARRLLGLRPAPEFEDWLMRVGIADEKGRLLDAPRWEWRAIA